MKKYLIVILTVILSFSAIFYFKQLKVQKLMSNSEQKVVVTDKNIPVKVEEIDCQAKSFVKDGESYVYLQVKNNSDTDLYGVFADVDDGKEVSSFIEHHYKIKAHSKSDNFGNLENSKDERVKIPITGKNKSSIKEVGELKLKTIEYLVKVDGQMKKVKYDISTKKYSIRNW